MPVTLSWIDDETIQRAFRLGAIMTPHPVASWFETRGVDALLAMRV
jgi:hypothetical protein